MRGRSSLFLACVGFAILAFAPDVAAAAGGRPVTTRDLATLTDIDGLSVSPDGRWLVFQTRRGDPDSNRFNQAWHIMPTAGGTARRIADGGEPAFYVVPTPRYVQGQIIVPPPVWSPDGRSIVYLRQDAGRTQLWRTSVDGKHTEQLTRNEGEMHGYDSSRRPVRSGFRYSTDGERLFFETRISPHQLSAAIAEEGRAGFRFDDRFMPGIGHHPFAPKGAALDSAMPGEVIEAGQRTTGLWVYDFARHQEHPATEAEKSEYATLQGASPKAPATNVRGGVIGSASGALAWTEARDPARQGIRPPKTLAAQPANTATPITCSAPICNSQFITAWMWRSDEELLFYSFADDLLSERAIYAWRPGDNAPPRVVHRTTGKFRDTVYECMLVNDRLLCVYEELTRPGRLVAINLDNGAVETLFDPNPQWQELDLGPAPEIVDVRLSADIHYSSYLVLPPGYQPGHRLPLVIVTYVCTGFLRGGTGDEYPILPLAAQGFAVLCHNHLQSDFAFQAKASRKEVQQEQYGPGDTHAHRIQAGVDKVIDDLDRRGVIDPTRIGLTGLSMGSITVRHALFNMPRLGAAIASTMTTPEITFTQGTGESRRRFRDHLGIESLASPRLRTMSIVQNAGKVRAPLLLHVSDQEMLGSVLSVGALEDAGRAVEMYVFPGEFHIKYQPAHRLAIYNRNIDWMNFWLLDREDPAPGKREQYERWSKLRTQHCKSVPAHRSCTTVPAN